MKIVITDFSTVSSDNDLSPYIFKELGDVTCYPLTSPSELPGRIKDAEIILTNKADLTADVLGNAPAVKYIGLFATGYNNVDIEYCHSHGITVCNAGNYSTGAVAQHTFAFILEHYNKVGLYSEFSASGGWKKSPVFTSLSFPTYELSGKTIGIVGFGNIGTAVAKIALAFGMKVLVYTRTPKAADLPVIFTELEDLLSKSDIVSVHCPLNKASKKMFDKETFSRFKEGSFFINTSRGGVVCEQALYDALCSGRLSGAGIDVLECEPMKEDCILQKAPNILITPHVAWAPYETRKRLLDIVYDNLKCFISGNPQNVV